MVIVIVVAFVAGFLPPPAIEKTFRESTPKERRILLVKIVCVTLFIVGNVFCIASCVWSVVLYYSIKPVLSLIVLTIIWSSVFCFSRRSVYKGDHKAAEADKMLIAAQEVFWAALVMLILFATYNAGKISRQHAQPILW